MAETITIPADLVAKAREKGWPDDLVQQALGAGASAEQIIGYLDQGVTAEQARGFLAAQAGAGPEPSAELKTAAAAAQWPDDLIKQALAAGASETDLMNFINMGITADQAREFMAQGGPPQLDLSWMHVPTEWNTRAKPTKHGLTLEAINIGKYGEIPDEWPYQTEMPRGAVPIPGVESMGYSIFQKQEVWSDNCARLYEEAIQRRWRPATDVPWASIEPLAEDVERAICQICTHISEKEQMEADVLSRWEPDISYGYHEVKLYLATTIFENVRAVEVFRKRALSNGGGLGVQSPGWGFRSIVDARNFTEMVAIQMVLQDSLTLAQYQYLEKYAKNPAEQYIAAHAMQDKARHLAYAVSHLQYVMMHRSERREEIMRYLDKGEGMMLQDDKKGPATREAFAVYFGGGKDNIQDGMRIYREMRKRAVEQYLARLKWATIERADRLAPELRAYLES